MAEHPIPFVAHRQKRRRAVITGLGALSPLGSGIDALWEGLRAGRSGIGPITHFDTDEKWPVTIAGEVNDFDPVAFLGRKEARRMDRFSQLALAAAQEAVTNAGLVGEDNRVPPEIAERVGCTIGTGVGGVNVWEEQMKVLLEKGPRRLSPFLIPAQIPNMAAGQVSIRFGLKGPTLCHVSACASGAHAVGEAARWVQHGVCDAVVAGASDTCITPLVIGGFAALKALSTRNGDPQKASRPFDVNRDGFVASEGAAVVVIEALEHALERGAPILAEITGYGSTSDAHHVTAPAPEGAGAVSCMSAALADAGLAPEAMDYINAHGTSTPLNDRSETLAIKKVFGDHARNVAISSTKSMTGHLLGAAGALEAVISILALREGLVPPTINLDEPDPECDLDYTPHEARPRESMRLAMSNSFGFGGHNVSLVFFKPDERDAELGAPPAQEQP